MITITLAPNQHIQPQGVAVTLGQARYDPAGGVQPIAGSPTFTITLAPTITASPQTSANLVLR